VQRSGARILEDFRVDNQTKKQNVFNLYIKKETYNPK
jgi:hypothetical protein